MERCITLFQPIASLVVRGIKTVETRSYRTHVRGRLWIHSSKAFPPDKFVSGYVLDEVFRFYALGGHQYTPAMALQEFMTWPRGCIIGYVDLVQCVRGEQAREALGALNYRREKALGDLTSADRFGWLLRDPVPLVRPIPATGSQGFWDCSQYVKDYSR